MDFGIQELEFLDDAGIFQKLTIADSNSAFGSLGSRAFVPRLLGLTLAAHTYNAVIWGTTTLFEWG